VLAAGIAVLALKINRSLLGHRRSVFSMPCAALSRIRRDTEICAEIYADSPYGASRGVP
jgi:hypothetical protein